MHSDNSNAVDTGFYDHTGKQGTGRGRSHRMGGRQPGVQGEHARFGAKTGQHTQTGRQQIGKGKGLTGSSQRSNFQGAGMAM